MLMKVVPGAASWLLMLVIDLCSSSVIYHDYIVVGAGPSGLQMGYFLDRAGRNYVILERGSAAGSFFERYPRHDQLISINKRHTGKTNVEFNLRHDWNSLVTNVDDDQAAQRFGAFSTRMFPRRQELLTYLNDFVDKSHLRVAYNTDVTNISRISHDISCSSSRCARFTMMDRTGQVYHCRTLIVATGMWQPIKPRIEGADYIEDYETVSTNPEDFEGQTVLILGRGNSAFELAQQIYGSTNLIHMVARSRVRLSWSTHYVGDLRAVNNELLDTYQLKSLDAVLEIPVEQMRIRRRNGNLYVDGLLRSHDGPFNVSDTSTPTMDWDNFPMREPYDRIISCLGFKFNDSLFSQDLLPSYPKGRKSKYPRIDHGYESLDYPGLYYAGTVTHSLDLRKSAGGFIHGFRYTARVLHRLLEWKNHGIPWPARSGLIVDLLTTILKRINEASGIYQMFSVLGDVILLRGDTFDYLDEVPINLLHELPDQMGHDVTRLIAVVMEYGTDFSGPGKDVFRLNRATISPQHGHTSNFLHPVFYYYDSLPTAREMESRQPWESLPRPVRLHHMVEDFLTSWTAPQSHVLPLRRFLGAVLGRDLRSYFDDTCLVTALTHATSPETCRQQFLKGQGLQHPPMLHATEPVSISE